LLAEYSKTGSEEAFRELVSRYVDLVYSAAVRLVNGDEQLAEDVTQTVFADLARMAGKLSRESMLGGWLHRHTCFVASKMMRSERRRLARERQAVEMNASEDHSAENFALIAPVLDEAVNQLGVEDRTAIMLRYFEQKDFKSVGEALGSNEEAARKRVDRALTKLESLLKLRGVALSGAALATTLAAQTVTAAPAGFALTISTAALASAAAGTGTTLTVLQIMSMTKLKIGIITAVVAAGVAIPWVMQHNTQAKLNEVSEALRKQREQTSHLVEENGRLSNLVAQTASTPAAAPSSDTMKLRGEVGRLRRENLEIAASKTNGSSPLSGMTDNPEMYQLIRKQQRAGMSMIYKDFTNRITLSPEQSEKMFDLLADNVMENIDRITEVLKDGKTGDALNQVFAAQEAAFLEKLQAVLTPEELSQYKDYTQNLASYLTAEQFNSMMSGDKAAKDEKAKQIYKLMQEETLAALNNAGLPADFQTTPTLNFRNMASEVEAEKNLKLLNDIYGRVLPRLGPVLSQAEIEKFNEFRSIAINGNRMNLAINRKMMAPGSK